MQVEVIVPDLGESISEVEVSGWLKQPGDAVERDEPLIELESDKATVEVPAPVAGGGHRNRGRGGGLAEDRRPAGAH